MKRISISESAVVPIVGDGAIAIQTTADGRIIPVLILDCDRHKELLNHIYLHENSLPGDVICKWAVQFFNTSSVFLVLDFVRPSTTQALLQFDLSRQALLADGIVRSCGVYLQPKESGCRVIEGLGQPKILIEVHPQTKLSNWDSILLKAIRKHMRTKGLSRSQAKTASEDFLKRGREMWGLRVGYP